ncbi:MAG: ribbon-helix-helix protein, CopG family [Deferrisomatales bacterium]|nr:ribbon-helix-helix protein, CopG family [Deferrisomatales bacterium]
MTTQMMVRMEPELKASLGRLAQNEGKSASQVVRELVEKYVRSRDPAAYLDGLWDRVGGQLAESGFRASDVDGIVSEVRKSPQ